MRIGGAILKKKKKSENKIVSQNYEIRRKKFNYEIEHNIKVTRKFFVCEQLLYICYIQQCGA